jgi:drug/metabolite transporter (DMT)-like permease
VYTISRGGAIVVVWPLSVLLFHEVATVAGAAGSAIVLAGLALASSSTGDRRSPATGALAWAIACAISIAGYHLSYKAALAAGGSPSAVFAVALTLATAINLSSTRGTLEYARSRGAARIVVMGVICGASFLILMEALASGGAGFVLTLRNTSVLFATALAFAIRERPRHVQIAGSVLVAAGAIVMAWP